mmetsp:Transcript_16963/g.19270  ORF Transcript_16963/g.19270 Transcript_16963/m.19270 type:complete len:508 (-) Transcript_16963:69-1592(-)
MGNTGTSASTTKVDYDAVRADLKELMNAPEWDDGTYAPLLIRLGWHSSGTYDASSETGGSNGATMRHSPEKDDPENAGLDHARQILEPIKKKHAGLSFSDLWILAAYVALEVTGGPVIEFSPGRSDKGASSAVKPGRLPEAEHGLGTGLDDAGRINGWENLAAHIRQVFSRMGFTDQETVALVCGGHVYGRCHPNLSGYAGAWVEEPYKFSNEYAADLIGDEWMYVENGTKVNGEPIPEETRPAEGKRQYMTKWEPSEMGKIENANATAYPPGKYKVLDEEYINVRRTHQTDSVIIDQPVFDTVLSIISTRKFGNGVRGQLDVGGWISIIASDGEEQLMERVGDLELVAANYRVLQGAGSHAKVYNSAPATREEIDSLETVGTLKAREVSLKNFSVLEAEDKSLEIFAEVDGGDYDGKFVPLLLQSVGAIFERIEPGYNDTPRKAIKKFEVKYQMMLPSDMVFLWDDKYRAFTEQYAEDEELLKKDFGDAFKKLTCLGFSGCPGMKK